MKRFLIFFICLLRALVIFSQSNVDEYRTSVRKAKLEHDKKNYQLALDHYEKGLKLFYEFSVLYNAACCASQLGDAEKTKLYLWKSIELGFLDKAWMEKDEELVAYKQTAGWEVTLKQIDEKISLLENKFAKVKTIPLSNLVPFVGNRQWGYLDRVSKDVIIEPMFIYARFAGDCLILRLDDQRMIKLDGAGKISVYYPKDDFMPPFPPPMGAGLDAIADTTRGFRGFKVNSYGRLTHVSNYYDESDAVMSATSDDVEYTPRPIVHSPVKLGENWYAIARKNGKYGVISQNGAVHPKIGFRYSWIKLMQDTKGKEPWYFFKDDKNGAGFINLKGEIRFYNEIDDYLNYKLEKTGFAVVSKNQNNIGVIDLLSMKWALKLGPYFIDRAECSYVGTCEQSIDLLNNRDKIANLYFYDSRCNCYIDKEGVKYLPKE